MFQKNNRLCSPFKRVLKLDDKNSALKSVLCMIIDKLNLEPNRDKKGIFKFTILPEKVKDLKLRIKKYPDVHIYIYIYIYTNDRYYDRTYSGKMMYKRLKKKLPVVCFEL